MFLKRRVLYETKLVLVLIAAGLVEIAFGFWAFFRPDAEVLWLCLVLLGVTIVVHNWEYLLSRENESDTGIYVPFSRAWFLAVIFVVTTAIVMVRVNAIDPSFDGDKGLVVLTVSFFTILIVGWLIPLFYHRYEVWRRMYD